MKLLIFIIILILILLIFYLNGKLNDKLNEEFETETLLTNANAKYLQYTNNFLINDKIQINPNSSMSITNNLSGNIITVSDISASNFVVNTLQLKSNVPYDKILINNDIISNIKNDTIQNFLILNNKNNYMYDPSSTIIYDEIYNYTSGNDDNGHFGTDILSNNTVITIKPFTQLPQIKWDPDLNAKPVAPTPNLYYGFNIYTIGPNAKRGMGIEISIPLGCNVLWIASLADRFTSFKICDLDDATYGIYAGGYDHNNGISPGGTVSTLSSQIYNTYSWIPIPLYWITTDTIPTRRKVRLICYKSADDRFWFSKIAFSSNPWNHLAISSQMFYYNINSIACLPNIIKTMATATTAATAVYDSTEYTTMPNIANYVPAWNGTGIVLIAANINIQIRIPIIKSGKDKILYFVTINRSIQSENLQVSLVDSNSNLIKLDNLKTSFTNPFARHYNYKLLSGYRATIIPDSLIVPDSFNRTFITINMFRPPDSDFYIRSFGTHDVN